MAQRLYPEAISVSGKTVGSTAVTFEPFLGISPLRYLDLFEMVKDRKDKLGSAVQWRRGTADPRLERIVGSYLEIETLAVGVLGNGLERAGLHAV
jgi:hypothetical protein